MLREIDLQSKAEELITKLGILTSLSKIGEVHLVGNVAFKTTVRPDIDIQLYAGEFKDSLVREVGDTLKQVGLVIRSSYLLKKSGKYLFICEYLVGNFMWNFDVSLTTKSNDYTKDSYRFYLDYKDKLDEEKRKLIKSFKNLLSGEKINNDNISYYIYLGVLEKGIKSISDMRKYLDEIKEEL